MLSVEDGAAEILKAATDKYEQAFQEDFPIFEYVYMTSGNGYNISIAGAKRLNEFIKKRIADKQPVKIPDGYNERVY